MLPVALLVACQPEPHTRLAAPATLTPLDTLLAIGRAATFVPELGDSQRLMIGSYPTGRHGPRVQLAPEQSSYAHEREDLRQPYLLARLINADAIPYPKMNLEAFDTVYIWTDRLSTVLPEGTVVLVSTRSGLRVERRLTFHPGPPFRATQPAARFRWDDDDEKTCVFCSWSEWCVIQ